MQEEVLKIMEKSRSKERKMFEEKIKTNNVDKLTLSEIDEFIDKNVNEDMVRTKCKKTKTGKCKKKPGPKPKRGKTSSSKIRRS